MKSVLPESHADELLRQAKRLRFRDPALERRYRDERIESGLTRARVMLALGMVLVCYFGYNQTQRPPQVELGFWTRYMNWELQLRFLMIMPAWLALYFATYVPSYRRWGEAANTVVTGWAAGLLLFHGWWRRIELGQPNMIVDSAVNADYFPALLISSLALAMGWRSVAAATLIALVPLHGWLLAAVPPQLTGLMIAVAVTAVGLSTLVIVFAWLRERTDRMLFAQRVSLARLNAELEQSRAELAAVNAEQAAFMGIAAHDLRAPLGVVRGLLELLREGRIAVPEKRDGALTQALGETARMHALVENYLGAHAAESGQLPVRKEALDLGAVARELVARHAATAAAKRQTLTTDAPTGRVRAMADAALLAQIGDNFVTNALKFSPAGAAVRIELLAAPGAGVARLAVVDDGPGVPAEEQGKLFQKFTRGAARPTGGESSAGLGLATARRLAEAMGGRVGCESPVADGRGACFWIELPEVTA